MVHTIFSWVIEVCELDAAVTENPVWVRITNVSRWLRSRGSTLDSIRTVAHHDADHRAKEHTIGGQNTDEGRGGR